MKNIIFSLMLLLSSEVMAQQAYCQQFPDGTVKCWDSRTGQLIIYRRGL